VLCAGIIRLNEPGLLRSVEKLGILGHRSDLVQFQVALLAADPPDNVSRSCLLRYDGNRSLMLADLFGRARTL